MLYVMIIGLSAFLLFQIQLIISKIILPYYGGGASIWLTSITFFQVLLLGGYASSHFFIQKLGSKKHLLLQASLVFMALIFLPIQARFSWMEGISLSPFLSIFLLLACSVGLPYFVLSTTSPVVQHWITVDTNKRGSNPYIQYAVSNAGSLGGLLVYPFWVEPNFTNREQTLYWTYGFLAYGILILLALFLLSRKLPSASLPKTEEATSSSSPEKIEVKHPIGRWLYHSIIPSAALLVTTHYLTSDIISFPLLWVLPLAIYLISFVICFSFPKISQPSRWRTLFTLIPVAGMIPAMILFFVMREVFVTPIFWQILVSCLYLFVICMFFHGELEREKPDPQHLTKFYTYVSLGGCLGSLSVSLIAPMIFHSNFEFYLVLFGALYLISFPFFSSKGKKTRVAFHGIALFFLVIMFIIVETTWHSSLSFVTYKTRSFYNTYVIAEVPEDLDKRLLPRLLLRSSLIRKEDVTNRLKDVKLLLQGTTIHGGQARGKDGLLLPVTYYHDGTGVGKVFMRSPEMERVAVVGLGVGTIAVRATSKQIFDFYEIDPVVVYIARNYFENTKESKAKEVHFYVGDGRIELRRQAPKTYDLIVMDAFTSDAVPTHLLTQEAIKELFSLLKEDGLVLYNISNHYVDLWPVLNGAAKKMGLHIRLSSSSHNPSEYKFAADWVILTRSDKTLHRIIDGDSSWRVEEDRRFYWSDDFSDIWSVLKY